MSFDDEDNKSIQVDKCAMIYVMRSYMVNELSLALVVVFSHVHHIANTLLVKVSKIYIINSNLKHQSRLQNIKNFLQRS